MELVTRYTTACLCLRSWQFQTTGSH